MNTTDPLILTKGERKNQSRIVIEPDPEGMILLTP
jgi:hypothetical protein